MRLNYTSIFHHLDNLNASVYMERDRASYVQDDNRWTVRIELSNNDTKLLARKTGRSADDALEAAYYHVMKIMDDGLPRDMKAPQLEHHGD